MPDSIHLSADPATPDRERDTLLTLPVDPDLLGRQLHRDLAPPHPSDGCVLCVPVKACCPGLLEGDECDCAVFAAEAAEVFKTPLLLDLRKAAA
jgi:hypothetical protein